MYVCLYKSSLQKPEEYNKKNKTQTDCTDRTDCTAAAAAAIYLVILCFGEWESNKTLDSKMHSQECSAEMKTDLSYDSNK